MKESKRDLDKEALKYHKKGRPGKIEVKSTKSTVTSHDLSLAYTPGVAAPCLEIAKDPEKAFDYTAKGNLVGVISNGSAVLGLGNIGALAGKPVMEGKGVLFKKFADIDVFDIEINQSTVEGIVETVKALEPTFGGINLEDIKSPECFEVEKQLIEEMNIPVFHDDQHGTAIICGAGFINAIEITKKKIDQVKIVFSGAGAAAMSCAKTLFQLGVRRENLIMCDSKGVIYKGRKEGMNNYKIEFAIETEFRTMEDALKNADSFMGLSARGVLSKEMVATMAPNPIIFAMANPEPEIFPIEVKEVRDDVIMATGRSDFPNQINNVLGFPFIFRGALDVRSTTINTEMKLAAVHALADLAKEEVPEEVKLAYGNEDFSFGPNYIIPKPFDKRVLTRVSPAVARAAIESGVARKKIDDFNAYTANLESRLDTSGDFMKTIRDKLIAINKKREKKVKVAFAEGQNSRVLQAAKSLWRKGFIEPIFLGDKNLIHQRMEYYGLDELKELTIITPDKAPQFEDFYRKYSKEKQREGVTLSHSIEVMSQPNYFGAMLAKEGFVDAFMNGPSLSYPECFAPLRSVISTQETRKAAGIYILTFKDRILFLADCTAQIRPTPEDLADIAFSTSELYRKLLNENPKISFLSFSNFGSNKHKTAGNIKKAVNITKERYPDIICDGEMQADVATNYRILKNLFPFSNLDGAANILIFPDLNSANISYKLLTQLSNTVAIGPLLVPMNKTVNILAKTSSVTEIKNMTILTALLSQA